MTRGGRVWLGVAALLALVAVVGGFAPVEALDWQPDRAAAEPWRALSAVGVHYSDRHLVANLAGLALTAALGAVAGLPDRYGWAWLAAWPLTQLGLAVQPALRHYGGLSGVLHAGVAVVAVGLAAGGTPRQRVVGLAIGVGLVAKVVSESPWGPPLRHPPGWDIAIAPLAHATGALAGTFCGGLCAAWPFVAGRTGRRRVDA